MSEKLLKAARAEISALVTMITEGAVPDFHTFLHLRARLQTWRQVEDQIILLRKDTDDDDSSS